MTATFSRGKQLAWQILFILLGTTWLAAPSLNPFLSDRTSLISQYETSGQAYAWLFRIGDVLASALIMYVALAYNKYRSKSPSIFLLLVIGVGMMIDPLFVTTCSMTGSSCVEHFSVSFLIHAIETVVTAFALLALALYDAKLRQKLVSIVFAAFQIVYGLLFLTQYADQQRFNTASQFAYQCLVVIWLAWFVRDYLFGESGVGYTRRRASIIRYGAAVWMLINGLLAIVLSLKDIHLMGRAQDLYFSRDTAWLAQHGVIVGVIMLYLSRHLIRGERRARQILLLIISLEVLKYAVITPSWPFVLFYSLSFCLLFVTVDDFRRGSIPLTLEVRLKELAFMVSALMLAGLLVLVILDRDSQMARIADRSFRNFSTYALHADRIHKTHKESVLLANTATAFLIVSTATVFWILFRPYKQVAEDSGNVKKVRSMLKRYSNSTEDYFKLWPLDKQYFWGKSVKGFIAYKLVGSVVYALADPIAPKNSRAELVQDFIEWARARRLRVCFLPIAEANLKLYSQLSTIQIGASALINTGVFVDSTIKDKWWRWKQNRAVKQGYLYTVNRPPHSSDFLNQLEVVSDDWLNKSGHKERGFALGYFDRDYLGQCTVHTLRDQTGQIVAFANQMPSLNTQRTATVDLMRFKVTAGDAMPYLLSSAIKTANAEGYRSFDLGFVPFAGTKGPLQTIARAMSASRFSANGLQQFKNKFNPQWQSMYLAYDGDLADLTVIALQVEALMEKSE